VTPSEFKAGFDMLALAIETFIQGNAEVVRRALVCLFAEGHLLIEGPPGVAKTSLARAIAASIKGADAKRIQFTPDLLPSDITGTRVYRQDQGAYPFEPGPVFTNILIADEINRASPRTQSALLEAMGERQVTVDGQTHKVESPFLCVATQNPLEYRGTFPLPEAQLDRFMMKVTMKPPTLEAELEVLRGGLDRSTPESRITAEIERQRIAEVKLDQVTEMIDWIPARVHVAPAIEDYVLRIVTRTRGQQDIAPGVSPRAAIALALAARARAASEGRDYTDPDDVKKLAGPVLAHRLVVSRAAADPQASAESVLAGLLAQVPPPDPRACQRPR